MKLINISLYTVVDIHENRETIEMGAQGVIARLVTFLFLLVDCSTQLLIGPCSDVPVCAGLGTNKVIRTVDKRS